MSNPNVKDKATVMSVEYAGLGSKPYFVIEVDGEIKFIPIELGSNTIAEAKSRAIEE